MKTLLVFPPQAHPTQPALCLPSLVAFLRARGFEDTHQRDFNLEAHEYFLSRRRLELSRERVQERFEGFPSGQPLPLREMDRFRVLAEASASADAVVDSIEEALGVLRDEQAFFDYDRYLRAVKTLDRAFRLVSAEHHPSSWTPHNYTMTHSIEREDEILQALGDPDANFLHEFLRDVALPEILRESPALLGISLTYTSQVIPGLALAALVKAARPDIHITVGGGLLAYIGEKMTRSGRVFDAIDSVVLLEGEGPLLEIARRIDAGEGVDGVGNTIFRKDGVVITNPPAAPLSIDDLPCPVFDGLPMDRYLAPKLALPLAITRGCYWEKCAFCTLYKVIGPGYRERSLSKVMDDIEEVTARWGSNVVYFIVEDMPPPVFKALPGALASRGLDIRWWTDARLERNLFTEELCRDLYASGCRRIAFGFESASQRLLDLMEKGTSLDEADGIVRRLSSAGISITLYTMIGFPTETRDEAEATLRWLREHRDSVHEVSLRIFYIDHLSKVYAHPEDYAVREILDDPDKDLQVYYDWVPGEGMSRREARELFFEFMKTIREEFPLFRGDNLQLFELKSHYFLYLDRFGDLSFLDAKHSVEVGEDPGAAVLDAVPAWPRGNKLVRMPYDLKTISERLNAAECSVLRPRYMSGSFKKDLWESEGDRVEPAAPRDNWVLYRAASSDLLHLGRDAAALLTRADGRRTVRELLADVTGPQQPRVLEFFRGLFRSGLWSRSQGQVPPRPVSRVSSGSRDLEVTAAAASAARDAEAMHLYCKPGGI